MLKVKQNLTFSKLRHSWVIKCLLVLMVAGLSILLTLFIFSKKYTSNHKTEKLTYGITFSAKQAQNFGLESDKVLESLLDDIGFRRFRLMSYWDDIEKIRGSYDYSVLDSQIATIKKRGGMVTLAIGLRQPRWPECFIPNWASNLKIEDYRNDLDNFIMNTVNRYKNDPSVLSWQLENEFHLDVFGACPDHSRRRLIEEYGLVNSGGNSKPIILTLANNYFGFPVGDPRPDLFGVSIYSRVFESRFLKKYISYPFPSWYYSGRAGITETLTGRQSFIHELQLEPWGPKPIWDMPVDEQNKSMDDKSIEKQLSFADNTGMKPIDLWGAEWWYWRKNIKNDPSLWNAVKSHVSNNLSN